MSYRFVSGVVLAICFGGLASCGPTSQTEGRQSPSSADARAVLETMAKLELARSPETASQLGLSEDTAGYAYSSTLDDRSEAGVTRTALERLEALSALNQINTDTLPDALASSVETVRLAYQAAVQMRTFGHGQVTLGFIRPYAVDQLAGGYIDVPDFLLNRQRIRGLKDAEAYLARLKALAGTIDDERRRLELDHQRGALPPTFILQRMGTLANGLIGDEDSPHPLHSSLENQLYGRAGIAEPMRLRLVEEAERLISDDVVPACKRLISSIERLQAEASDAPGIWQLENGTAYYEAALKFYSGRDDSAAIIHQDGAALVRALSAQLDVALIDQGYTEGSVGERLAALSQTAEQTFTNDEEGRLALLNLLDMHLSSARTLVPQIVETPPDAQIVIAAVPELLNQTAPGGYYVAPPANKSAPGLFFINLRDTQEWPAFTLPTLLYHETLPGHHLESTLVAEQAQLPLIRQLIWNPTFGEGWAVYAEDLAYEFGAYENDPLGEIGYLQSLLFRAARLVVDTGLHHKRWSREQAIDYLVSVTGQHYASMETEVDRYTVWPGQATSYMSGRQILRELRTNAQNILGESFSLKEFHATLLNNGPRPMQLVERDVEAWIVNTLETRN